MNLHSYLDHHKLKVPDMFVPYFEQIEMKSPLHLEATTELLKFKQSPEFNHLIQGYVDITSYKLEEWINIVENTVFVSIAKDRGLIDGETTKQSVYQAAQFVKYSDDLALKLDRLVITLETLEEEL